MPEVKFPADGNTRVAWVPGEDGIGNVHFPELSELNDNDVEDLSCHIMSGGLDMGISQGVIDTASICSAFVSQANGRVTVSPSLTFWRYTQPDDTAWDLFETGAVGWLVIRTGVDYETDWAVGQKVTVAYVQMSEPAPEFAGGDTASTFVGRMLLVQGDMFDQKAEIVLVASA